MNEFYLSIVAVSRNDDHGGQLLTRMQAFVNGVIQQSKRHQVSVELILVEWNPPDDRPLLSEELEVPKDKGPCEIRIIQVSKELHHTLDCSENLPLFQMIAKNVGIRRARGEYVLATNIDILFSDELFSYFKEKKLKPGVFYRVDRLDIPSEVPKSAPFNEVLDYCKDKFFRINGRFGTKIPNIEANPKKVNLLRKAKKQMRKYFLGLKVLKPFLKKLPKKCLSKNIFDLNRWKTLINYGWFYIKKLCFKLMTKITVFKFFTKIKMNFKVFQIFFKISRYKYCLIPHSNGCGDFTLLSRKGWEVLRGYPEWPIFSWHIDSLFLYQAIVSDFKEKNFGPTKPIYHIEHGKGSGYTPEGFQLLLKRLDKKNIPYLDMRAFNQHIRAMKKAKAKSRTLIYNHEDWGMVDQKLKEFFI